MKNKKTIFIGFCILGILLIVVGFFLLGGLNSNKKKPEDNNPSSDEPSQNPNDGEENIFASPELKKDKDIELLNLSYSEKDDGFLLKFDIVNNGKKDFKNLVLILNFVDENGQSVFPLELHLGEIKKGEKTTVERKIYALLPKVFDYELIVSSVSQ